MQGVKGTAGSGWSANELRQMATGKYNPLNAKGKKLEKFKQKAKEVLTERGLSMKPRKIKRQVSWFGSFNVGRMPKFKF